VCFNNIRVCYYYQLEKSMKIGIIDELATKNERNEEYYCVGQCAGSCYEPFYLSVTLEATMRMKN
jgi:hypothetical protein